MVNGDEVSPVSAEATVDIAAGPAGVGTGGHLAHQVSELVDGLELGAFYRPYEEDGRRNSPYNDGEGVDLRLRDRGILVAQDCEEAGGGCGVSDAGGGELSAASDAVRVSPAAFEGLQAAVCASGGIGAGDGDGEVGAIGDRWDEGAGEREPAQGDELRADAGAGAATEGRDR